MKIAKVLNPVTLNSISVCDFPVRHLPALLHYLLYFYGHFFLKVFIISHPILDVSQPFCFSVMLFHDAPNIIPISFTFCSIWYLIWSYPVSIEFCVHLLLLFCLNYSILRWYLLTLALFASILCWCFSITVFNSFFSLYIFHLIHSICFFSSVPVLP